MQKKDKEYIKMLLLKKLNEKKLEFEKTKDIDLIKEIEYIKKLLERL